MSVKNFSRLAIMGTIFWMSSAMAIVFPGPPGDGNEPFIPLPGNPPPKIQMSSSSDMAIQFPGPGEDQPTTPNPGPGPGQDPTPRMQLASSNSNSAALLAVVQQLSPADKQAFLEALLADPANGNAAADILAEIGSQYR